MSLPRKPIALVLIGLALVIVGLTFKLNHLMGAHAVFNLGAACSVLGLGWTGLSLLVGRSKNP